MIRQLSIVLLLTFTSGLYAQKQDTVKKERIFRLWHLSSDYSEEVPVVFDTVFSLFNRYRITDKYSPVNASLGSYGLPLYQINFFDRITDPDKFLYTMYYPLMHVSDNALFMNTQAPFTEVVWSFAGPRETSEQTFRVMHSQNVNRFLNFGLIFDIVYNLGQYNYQRAEDKNFTIWTSYTGIKYKVYFSAGINNMKAFENGGIINKDDLATVVKPRDVPVKLGGLNKAYSLLKNRNLLLVQKFTIGGEIVSKSDSSSTKKSGLAALSGTFSHILEVDNNHRRYFDEYPKGGFYDSILISDRITRDSLSSKSLKNTIRFDFDTDESRKFRLGGGVGIRNELFRYSQIRPTHDTLVADTLSWKRNNNVLVGRLYNSIGERFRWVATGELFLTGYRSGDFNLKGEILKQFGWKKGLASWIIRGGIMNRQPSIWYGQWGSNHFEWSTNMNKEFRIDLGSSFIYPARKTELRFNYAIIDNYTDFDSLALPTQFSGGLSVAALTLSKELKAWKFHLNTDLILQTSSNPKVLDLPLATIRSALFFEHLFRFENTGGKINTQLGADITYHTRYYAYSYMPATGRFYHQQDVKTGDYPFINVFVNIKIKRTRLFLMMDHVNAGMINYDYDMVPLYPMNIRMFRYGIAWTFYN